MIEIRRFIFDGGCWELQYRYREPEYSESGNFHLGYFSEWKPVTDHVANEKIREDEFLVEQARDRRKDIKSR